MRCSKRGQITLSMSAKGLQCQLRFSGKSEGLGSVLIRNLVVDCVVYYKIKERFVTRL